MIEDGVVVVKTTIIACGPRRMTQYRAEKVIDAQDGIVMPGMATRTTIYR
ncbi:hypothetical protein O9992_21740 [Vibrio lentus]|nr:hypothetical protein [Vibrio lentus]